MENRTLEINVMSATGLNKVNLISKMDVYVVVFIEGGGAKNKQKKKTPVNNNGDTNPSWNCPPFKFTVDEVAARQNRLTLVFQLRCERALGDGDIGEVRVPVRELIDSPAARDGKAQFVNYQVRKPNGKPKGQLTFSYKFVDQMAGTSVAKVEEPLAAYPAGPSSAYPLPSKVEEPAYPAGPSSAYPLPSVYPTVSYHPAKYEAAYPAAMGYPQALTPRAAGYLPSPQGAYPPPPHGAYPPPPQGAYPPPPQGAYPPPPQGAYGYGHPYPPPYGGYPPPPPTTNGYGYAPAPGYGYPQVVQPTKPPRKNNLGMGLGAGLLGGAVGGLLVGDMISDSSAYDSGYDAGYDDGAFDGGFDF